MKKSRFRISVLYESIPGNSKVSGMRAAGWEGKVTIVIDDIRKVSLGILFMLVR